MKKIILAILFIASINICTACEICGCGLGNYYIGLMPQFKHKFIGLRYQYRNFKTVMADDASQFSKDYYKTIEVWGGFAIGKKWQIMTILPYNYIHQLSDEGITNRNGIGDIALMANHKFLDKNSVTKNGSLIQQQLWLGVGVKLPTGKFTIDTNDPAIIALANTQTGSASTDFMLNAMYSLVINKININTSASYKINTVNNDNYYFGNKFSINSFVSYPIKKEKILITPNVGLLFENAEGNKIDAKKIEQTGGRLLASAAGIELDFKQFTIGGNVQLPVSQNFSNGQTKLSAKAMLHITFGF
jgi:hypothetical protein